MRVDVLGIRDAGQRRDHGGLDVDLREPELTESERLERRRKAIGGERERSSVRRPRGLQVGKRVARERLYAALLEIEHVEIAQTAGQCRERNALAVGGPRRAKRLIGPMNGILALE